MNQVLNRCIVCLRENCDERKHNCDEKTMNFIKRARSIHDYRYNYEKVQYINAHTKVKIICLIHDEFEQTSAKHINGKQNCSKCSKPEKLTNEEFIRRANEIHGENTYDYSLVEYKTLKEKIKIICPIHGQFEQTPATHIYQKSGCHACGGTKKLTNGEFIRRANEIHGENTYDYFFVNYIDNKTAVKIMCPIHGIYEQIPNVHINQQCGCSYCGGTRKLTTIEFICQAKMIHGNKYDYSLVEYQNGNTKVKIVCDIHGEFEQTPSTHIHQKSGCPKCNGGVKFTLTEFIDRANEVHNNKYDYSKVVYINSDIKVEIICEEHGEFEQIANNHINKKYGCPYCSGCKKLTTGEFIQKAKKVHGNKYDYSLSEYKNNHTNIKIICPTHGEFKQTSATHFRGSGCPKCSGHSKPNTREFIEKAIKIHGDKYDYSKVEYINAKAKIIIICKKHGEFMKNPNNHLSSKSGCPVCNESHGEKALRVYAEENKIESNSQFDKILKYRYDRFFTQQNILIEYDGKQHFDPESFYIKKSKKPFEYQTETDIIKTKLALENGYFIVRIPYTEIKRINEILDDVIENPRSLIVFSKTNNEINEIYKEHNLLIQQFSG